MNTPSLLPRLRLLVLAALMTPLAASAQTADWFAPGAKWTFNNGYEFRNKETGQTAKGSFEAVKVDGKDAGKLDFDFTEAGAYVLGSHPISGGTDFNEVRLTVKGDTAANVIVRIEDSSKETFQYKSDYTTPGQPQVLRFDLTKPMQTFGGNANKVFDTPVSAVHLGATKKGEAIGGKLKGTLYFSDVELIKN